MNARYVLIGLTSLCLPVWAQTTLPESSSSAAANSAAVHDAQDHQTSSIDEIVVTGLRNKSSAETALPINVIDGEALRKSAAATLGDTLQGQMGVNSTSFGNGVGQPVIRGLSGNRVAVLQNGLTNLDASGVSQDHSNALEPLLAERIEIVRGPASLLYGGSAIGGVVNVLDNRVPARLLPYSSAIELRGNSVDSSAALVAKTEGSHAAIAWHLDALYREGDDLKIPGEAVDTNVVFPEDPDEPLENTQGFIANSNTKAHGYSGGLSWIDTESDSFFGISVGQSKNNYGLPPGAHAHHVEEHEEEEEEEEHHEEAEQVRLVMDQTRVDLNGATAISGFFNRLEANLAYNNYEHRELEGDAIGTVFSSEGFDSRLLLRHDQSLLSGAMGIQLARRNFAAAGEEAFIRPTRTDSFGLFVLESVDTEHMIYEAGLRFDKHSVELDGSGNCNRNDNSLSASLSAIWKASESHNLSATLNRAARAPSAEERYSNIDSDTCSLSAEPVMHMATVRIELGNPDLKTETANAVELGWHKHNGEWRAQANLFFNRFANYIYLNDIGVEDETIVSAYQQVDADFAGAEATFTLPIATWGDDHLDLSVFGDYVTASIRSGDYLPRIPAARIGGDLSYHRANWSTTLGATWVDGQTRLAPDETSSTGYTRWDASMDYHWQLANTEVLLFVKANNITDIEIRDHTSFMKNYAPLAGRGIEIGLRSIF